MSTHIVVEAETIAPRVCSASYRLCSLPHQPLIYLSRAVVKYLFAISSDLRVFTSAIKWCSGSLKRSDVPNLVRAMSSYSSAHISSPSRCLLPVMMLTADPTLGLERLLKATIFPVAVSADKAGKKHGTGGASEGRGSGRESSRTRDAINQLSLDLRTHSSQLVHQVDQQNQMISRSLRRSA